MDGWRHLLRPGDYLVIALTAALVAALMPLALRGGKPEKAVVRANGRIVAEVDLAATKALLVPGPLGTTAIHVEKGRARVASDPGPRQYCVLQGWLARAGDVAVCAPNQVVLQIIGHTAAYDSLAY